MMHTKNAIGDSEKAKTANRKKEGGFFISVCFYDLPYRFIKPSNAFQTVTLL